MKNIFSILLLIWVCSGCQTLDSQRIITPSRDEKTYFSECEKNGGFAQAEVVLRNKLRYQGDFEWDIKGENLYSFSLLSPFGETIFKAEKEENLISIKGSHLDQNFQLRVDKNDFLHLNNHWIALKSSELGCFLGGKFSSAWLELPFYSLKNKKEYFIPDGKRRILLKFPENKDDLTCAEISWQSFWIFKISRIHICFKETPVKTSSLKLDDSFQLEIEDVYGEGI